MSVSFVCVHFNVHFSVWILPCLFELFRRTAHNHFFCCWYVTFNAYIAVFTAICQISIPIFQKSFTVACIANGQLFSAYCVNEFFCYLLSYRLIRGIRWTGVTFWRKLAQLRRIQILSTVNSLFQWKTTGEKWFGCPCGPQRWPHRHTQCSKQF